MSPVNVVCLVVSCLAMMVAMCFLMAAVFTFALYDQKPVDRETDKMLSQMAWFGGGWFIYFFVVTCYWCQCSLGRRFFYVGLASGVVGIALSLCNAYGG